MKKLIIIAGLGLGGFIFSCSQSGQKERKSANATAQVAKDTTFLIAEQFFKPLPQVATNEENKVTPQKVKLGKVLYYDTRLSKTGKNSCNSCHNLSTSGVDNQATSLGDAGQRGSRNSPTVFNAALQNMQFWDGRAKDVEEQAGMPILNPVEMAIPHKDFLVDRLRKIKLYQDLFKEAFPGQASPISYDNLQKAIAAFERTLLTPSRFDQYLKGDENALNSEEKAGLSTFIKSGCPACHSGVGIGGGSLQKFGLVTDYRTLTHSTMEDLGRQKVTGKRTDKDVFKVPNLRNVKGTFPYFHDGSIASLDTAIRIMGKAQLNQNLSDTAVKQIIAFLNATSGDITPEAKTPPVELEH